MLGVPRRFIWFALIAIAARAITFGNPILHVDEQYYFTVAWEMWRGALPYTDIWDRKPIGLFLLYMPAARLPLPWAIYAYQAMAAAFVIATAWLIARLSDRAGWSSGATLAGAAYILWLNLAEGQGGQAPVFYNLLMVAAATLIADDIEQGETHARVRPFAAMLLVGFALQIKYSVVFEGIFFGLWILRCNWHASHRAGQTIALAIALVATALTPTLIALTGYALLGHLGDFWFANAESILGRKHDPLVEQLGNLGGVVLILSPLVAMAGITLAGEGRLKSAPTRQFLFGWLAAALVGLLVFGSWFDHYTLPVMAPAAACAAGAMGNHHRIRRWALPILLIVAAGGQALLLSKRLDRGTPDQFRRLAATVGTGSGCLYVYSRETMLYPYTGRCLVSRYVFPSHLGRAREQGAIGVDQRVEVARILAAHPAVIVMRPPYRGERASIRNLVSDEVRRHYRLMEAMPLGNETVNVYRHLGG